MTDAQFQQISRNLSPEKPIRSSEFLRGRDRELSEIVRELTHFDATVFVYGYRGVGKTSLARTAAQIVTESDREHIYVACAPGARMLQIFRAIGEEVLKLLFDSGALKELRKRIEVELSLSPAIRASFEKNQPKLSAFDDASAAIRVLKDLDQLLPNAESTVVVIDELEELSDDDRTDLAYLIKQVETKSFV